MSSVNGRSKPKPATKTPAATQSPGKVNLDKGALDKVTLDKVTVEELSRRLHPALVYFDKTFSYYLGYPVAEEDLRQYLEDPIGSLPAEVLTMLPKIGLILVPHMEKGTTRGIATVVYEKPAEAKLMLSAAVKTDSFATLFFTIKDEQVSDYHYYFFEEVGALIADRIPEKANNDFQRLLREELSAEVHGEVDERSWHLKQSLLRRPMAARKDSKPFRDYARQSFVDTMTLYLHGICCDIDVETGPRQLPSRYLRKRLEALKALFPPPEGHAVFPEDLKIR